MLASSRDRESVPPAGAATAAAPTIRPPWESDERVVPPWVDPAMPTAASPAREPVSPARSRPIPRPLRDRDESDPERRAVELAQRGRIILDVSIADLEVAEAVHGAFHPIAWHFRNACNEARRSWDRLRAELGTRTLEAALIQPPLVVMTLGEDSGQNVAAGTVGDRPRVRLLVIGGKTYCAQRVAGTALAPIQWRLTRPHPPLENGPYFACRLAGGATQCDCAEWTYQVAENPDARLGVCKHIAALASLGWI